MKLASKKPSKSFMIIMTAIFTPILVGFLLALVFSVIHNISDKKYNDKSFQAYEERYKYCAGFFGGVGDNSREDIYRQWKNKDPIGC
jgi:hypothetical protein